MIFYFKIIAVLVNRFFSLFFPGGARICTQYWSPCNILHRFFKVSIALDLIHHVSQLTCFVPLLQTIKYNVTCVLEFKDSSFNSETQLNPNSLVLEPCISFINQCLKRRNFPKKQEASLKHILLFV